MVIEALSASITFATMLACFIGKSTTKSAEMYCTRLVLFCFSFSSKFSTLMALGIITFAHLDLMLYI